MAYNSTKLHTWGPSVPYPRGRPNNGAELDNELDRAYESLNDLHARLLAGITNAPTWSEVDKAPTAAQVAARIAQAISDLLDGAPGALDTLNELAAALGDDANFASTVTTALAARYLKTEIDAFFEGESGGKKQVSWNRLTDVPSIEGQRRAHAGGTADAISATFTPTVTTLADGMTVYVRAAAANTIPGVVFQADGTTAKPVVKGADKALEIGDIAGAGHWLELQFDSTLDKWVMQNPANGIIAQLGVGQTWQNVTASRAFNTNYTNNTGRTIEVSVICTSEAGVRTLEPLVDGVSLGQSYDSSSGRITRTFIVPKGATYRVNLSGPSTLHYWVELR